MVSFAQTKIDFFFNIIIIRNIRLFLSRSGSATKMVGYAAIDDYRYHIQQQFDIMIWFWSTDIRNNSNVAQIFYAYGSTSANNALSDEISRFNYFVRIAKTTIKLVNTLFYFYRYTVFTRISQYIRFKFDTHTFSLNLFYQL